jgi:hypothetical protein
MAIQPKLITLEDCDLSKLEDIALIGNTELSVFSDDVLNEIIKRFDKDGEIEIIKMVDRGQIFQSQAKRVLGEDKYQKIGKLIPCEWI